MFGVLMLAFVVVVYATCRRFGSPLASAAVTAAVVLAAAPELSARPQVVSLILIAVTVGAWLRTFEDGRLRWWLVPLTWVWATAHGLWSAGILIGVVACVGMVLDRRAPRPQLLKMLGVLALSVLVTALTPVGPRLLSSQLAVSARTSLITEWGPTSFRELPALLAAALVAGVVVLWARRGGMPWTHLLLLLLATGWMCLATRLVACAVVVVAPLLVAALRGGTFRPPAPAIPRWERIGVAALAVAYTVALTLAVPHTATEAGGVPRGFDARLGALPAKSTVLVEDGVGGWIEWRHPETYPVIDPMFDAYPVDYIRAVADLKHLEPGWQRFVRGSRAAVAVTLDDSPLSTALQDQLGWTQVQKDGDWVYLEAPDAG
jgi:hypothetical protein